jgi:hypothetical protein
MSWKRFRKGFGDLLRPPHLRNITPEERKKRELYSRRNDMAFPAFCIERACDDKDRKGDDRRKPVE